MFLLESQHLAKTRDEVGTGRISIKRFCETYSQYRRDFHLDHGDVVKRMVADKAM